MILEKNWQPILEEIEHRFHTQDVDGNFCDTVYPEDMEFLLDLIDELKKVAF